MHRQTGSAPTGDRKAPAGLDARFVRVVVFGVLLALLPARLAAPTAHHPFPFASSAAQAEDGEGDGGGEGEGGEGEGGDGEGGDGESGDGDSGGDDGGSDDGGEDGDDHGATGSSISGFLGALIGHGKVDSAYTDSNSVSVTYSDGWTERVSSSRYQLLDRRNRVVVSRKARPLDIKRLRAAAGL